jgi:hypothetical protein
MVLRQVTEEDTVLIQKAVATTVNEEPRTADKVQTFILEVVTGIKD